MMCDPYYEDCPVVCDPNYEDCPEMMPEMNEDMDMEADMDEDSISHMPFYMMMIHSTVMVLGSFYGYTEQVLTKTDGDNYKGMFYATQLTFVPIWATGINYAVF
jgi:hypothetical protein